MGLWGDSLIISDCGGACTFAKCSASVARATIFHQMDTVAARTDTHGVLHYHASTDNFPIHEAIQRATKRAPCLKACHYKILMCGTYAPNTDAKNSAVPAPDTLRAVGTFYLHPSSTDSPWCIKTFPTTAYCAPSPSIMHALACGCVAVIPTLNTCMALSCSHMYSFSPLHWSDSWATTSLERPVAEERSPKPLKKKDLH